MTYRDTFITVAPDCPAAAAVVPAARPGAVPAAHVLHYALLAAAPYRYTHLDLLAAARARAEGLSGAAELRRARELAVEIGRTPQACMRTSALPKRYGWGVHYDAAGRLALYARESAEYARLAAGAGGVKVLAAMRSGRA